LHAALFDDHEFTADRSSPCSVNDLKGREPFAAGDERLLLATDNPAELLYLQAERIVVRRNGALDLESSSRAWLDWSRVRGVARQ
jgi:hypothetical protein